MKQLFGTSNDYPKPILGVTVLPLCSFSLKVTRLGWKLYLNQFLQFHTSQHFPTSIQNFTGSHDVSPSFQGGQHFLSDGIICLQVLTAIFASYIAKFIICNLNIFILPPFILPFQPSLAYVKTFPHGLQAHIRPKFS